MNPFQSNTPEQLRRAPEILGQRFGVVARAVQGIHQSIPYIPERPEVRVETVTQEQLANSEQFEVQTEDEKPSVETVVPTDGDEREALTAAARKAVDQAAPKPSNLGVK